MLSEHSHKYIFFKLFSSFCVVHEGVTAMKSDFKKIYGSVSLEV